MESVQHRPYRPRTTRVVPPDHTRQAATASRQAQPPLNAITSKRHFECHLLPSSPHWKETHHSPTRLGGHYHVNSVHTDAHDVNDSLSRFRVGQAEDAQGLEAGGIAARHRTSPLGALAVFSHLALRKLPQSNLFSTSPLNPYFILLSTSLWIHQTGKGMAACPRKSIHCFLFLHQVFQKPTWCALPQPFSTFPVLSKAEKS